MGRFAQLSKNCLFVTASTNLSADNLAFQAKLSTGGFTVTRIDSASIASSTQTKGYATVFIAPDSTDISTKLQSSTAGVCVGRRLVVDAMGMSTGNGAAIDSTRLIFMTSTHSIMSGFTTGFHTIYLSDTAKSNQFTSFPTSQGEKLVQFSTTPSRQSVIVYDKADVGYGAVVMAGRRASWSIENARNWTTDASKLFINTMNWLAWSRSYSTVMTGGIAVNGQGSYSYTTAGSSEVGGYGDIDQGYISKQIINLTVDGTGYEEYSSGWNGMFCGACFYNVNIETTADIVMKTELGFPILSRKADHGFSSCVKKTIVNTTGGALNGISRLPLADERVKIQVVGASTGTQGTVQLYFSGV